MLISILGSVRPDADRISENKCEKPCDVIHFPSVCCVFWVFSSVDMVLPPAYPPPPVPHVRKVTYSESRANSFSGKPSAPVPPPPPPKRSLPEIKVEDLLHTREPQLQCRPEPHLKMPSPSRRPSEQLPPVPPLFKKPACAKESSSLPPEPLPLAQVLATPEGCEKLKTLNLSPRTPPPVPSNKPKLSQLTEKPVEPRVPREAGKPGLFVPPMLPKPPVPCHQPPAIKTRPERSCPQLQ